MSWRGRLSETIRELTFFLSSGPGGNAPRRWLWYNYSDLKRLNPNMPMIVKTTAWNESSMTARYDFGREKSLFIHNNSDVQMNEKLKKLWEKGKTLPKSNETTRIEPQVIDAHDKRKLFWGVSH